MSYRDPYSDPYSSGPRQTNQTDLVHSVNSFDFNPYSHLSHPTYDQSGYGASDYADDPTYPPQRQPTQRNGSGNPTRRKETYQPDADSSMVHLTKQTASTLRQYRYDRRGALWTKGGRGRCIGRFCCCTIMTILFLIVSIVLALALWIRPPAITIGQVTAIQQNGNTITTSSDGDGIAFSIHLALNITVDNPNYFSVNFKDIKAELFYPINNTPIGGGTSTNVVFPANSQTNWTFPFDAQYRTSIDTQSRVISDLLTKCGANPQNVIIDFTITPALRILLVTISPSISNSFSFPCPVNLGDIPTLTGLGGS